MPDENSALFREIVDFQNADPTKADVNTFFEVWTQLITARLTPSLWFMGASVSLLRAKYILLMKVLGLCYYFAGSSGAGKDMASG